MENYENIHLPWSDWKIVKYLGGGAYGKVYEIERTISGIQEKAALKIISRPKEESELEADYQNGYDQESIAAKYTEILQDYIKEYKLMKELQGQSNIVSCDDCAIEENPNGIGGKIYIRMELLTPLQKVTKESLLSEEEVIKLGKDICKALILCESRNIIHRDIKPDNIMISRFGDYKLGDFGVSKVMSHTTGGTMTGTDGYIAPEVLHMEKYGKEVDIYSLGIVMYWLLNNRRMPFIGADEKLTPSKASEASMRRYQGEKLPAPKNGTAKLKKIVLKACEYHPENRYASAQELYDDLNSLRSGKTKNSGNSEKESVTPKNDKSVKQENHLDIGGVTQGNSWGETGGTIGKLNKPQKTKQPTEENQEEPKTIGPVAKQPKEPKYPKKEENNRTVTADTYQKRFKRTPFGYIWNILTIALFIVYVVAITTKEGFTGETAAPCGVLVILGICELVDLVKGKDNYPGIVAVGMFLADGGMVLGCMFGCLALFCKATGIDLLTLLDGEKIPAIMYILDYILLVGVIFGGFIGGAIVVDRFRYKEE